MQLTAIDGAFDLFWRFRDLLCARADLRAEYDALKRGYEGAAMDEYRKAKSRFFDKLRPEAEALSR